MLPREQTRVDDLSQQIAEQGVVVPRSRFSAEPWNLEPPSVTKLMDKLRAVGVPLKDFAGVVPLYGIKTGFNEAFLIDTPTKEKLVAADPTSAPLFKPYLRGQDIDRWRAGWSGLWMIAMKSSGNHEWPWSKATDELAAEAIFAITHPALHAHMNGYRVELTKRSDSGVFWWELRSCSYWDRFDAPKLIVKRIAFHPSFAYDISGLFLNDSATFLPACNPWLHAVLSSPAMWYYAFRTLPHKKDEALSMDGNCVEELPIPKPTDAQRSEVEAAVGKLIELAAKQQTGRAAVLDWLRVEFGVEKASQKLQAVADLDADTLISEVKKARGKAKPLSVVDLKRLRDEHTASVLPLHALARETEQLERRVSDIVNAAFGLTPDEVKLMWDTAPPRMPIAPPNAV